MNLYVYVNNNPIGYVDPKGLETVVTIWQPVGWGASSFGHVSTSINDTTYSFGPSGMSILPTEVYLGNNSFRSGVGTTLNLSSEQESQLQSCMSNFNDSYNALKNNCGAPIQNCLRELGHDLGGNLLPVSLGNSLLDSELAKEVEFYPQTIPATGTSAPWAK
ncbi:hypothetical protein GCM10007158_05750 [Vreelandella hamiltonii]|uniref:RHS repeat-associated core domain-containing protein n=1 Tax=Halomonas johnsoniae TaxID=502832 RepID=A0ABQ2WEU4_9GAMM|nr:hypothetical protein GCM10007158_05750 [Halomonas johnsoniae]